MPRCGPCCQAGNPVVTGSAVRRGEERSRRSNVAPCTPCPTLVVQHDFGGLEYFDHCFDCRSELHICEKYISSSTDVDDHGKCLLSRCQCARSRGRRVGRKKVHILRGNEARARFNSAAPTRCMAVCAIAGHLEDMLNDMRRDIDRESCEKLCVHSCDVRRLAGLDHTAPGVCRPPAAQHHLLCRVLICFRFFPPVGANLSTGMTRSRTAVEAALRVTGD